MTAATEHHDDDVVPAGLARDFVHALRRVEDEGSVDDMIALFDPEAELSRLGHPTTLTGQDGARRFWEGYGESVAEIASRFSRTTSTDERVVLEWTAQVRLHDGKTTAVDGVSVLDLGDGNLVGFRTYYDTAAFISNPTARTG